MIDVNSICKLIWEQNRGIVPLLNNNIEFVHASILKFESLGLSYIDNDYYTYQGKGGLKIHETPKGVKKRIAQIAHKYNLSVVVTDGVFYKGDTVTLESDGTIEQINIKKNSQSLIMGGEILAPYAIVSVFKDNVMITRKMFIVPNDEYKVIRAMGTGNKFNTMMAYKMVYKRVLNGIFSLLGVTLDREDAKLIDDMAENMRVDRQIEEVELPKSKKTNSMDKIQLIKDSVDLLDIESVIKAKKEVLKLYSSEVSDRKAKAEIHKYGTELKGILDELSKNKSL